MSKMRERAVVLNKVAMVGFILKVKFSQRLEEEKSIIQEDIWEKNIPGERNSQRIDLKVGKSLEFMKNIKEPPCNSRRLNKGESMRKRSQRGNGRS